MNKTIQKLSPLIGCLFFIVGVVHCSDQSLTTNQVRPIEISDLHKMVSSDDFNGLIVAMASWCPPCREELPILADLYLNYKNKGIDIVAISIDAEGPAGVQQLINELKIPFPVYWVGTAAVQQYKIVGVPTLLVYQRGRLLEKIPGSQPRKAIEDRIKTLIASG